MKFSFCCNAEHRENNRTGCKGKPLVCFGPGKKINTDRANIYNIFKRKTIDTGLLCILSEVLGHDFFQYYIQGRTKNVVHEPAYHKMDNDSEKLKQRIESLEEEIKTMKERLTDKEIIIKLLQQNLKK